MTKAYVSPQTASRPNKLVETNDVSSTFTRPAVRPCHSECYDPNGSCNFSYPERYEKFQRLYSININVFSLVFADFYHFLDHVNYCLKFQDHSTPTL